MPTLQIYLNELEYQEVSNRARKEYMFPAEWIARLIKTNLQTHAGPAKPIGARR